MFVQIIAGLLAIGGLAFIEAPIYAWSAAVVLALISFQLFYSWSFFYSLIFWIPLFAILIILNVPAFRQRFFTRFVFHAIKGALPVISKTEQEAIDAGDVWWEGNLFQGKVKWSQLLAMPKPSLSKQEKDFLDNQVERLCEMLNEWEITQHLLDLPENVWSYLKDEKFFGMLIPKKYGGLGFSALGNSTVVQKIATRSLTAAVTTMVPNSLGPAELLLAYGTEEQKNYYLPRLATGLEIPCFALTGPEAGSDAGSIPDSGIICRGEFEGKNIIGIKLTWDKRYITLAPLATVLGLAFKLHDPEQLMGNKKELGITLCLIPTNHPGVEIGKRHFPLNQPFMNGPTRGRDVFIPIDWIIGGPNMAGKGWRMIVECLSAGRGISLPSVSTAAAKHCYRVTGAYALIRKQFNTAIGHFEGVIEVMAKIAGFTYILEATRVFTLGAIDQHIKPSVACAIAKYHMTEAARSLVNDAMDVHGGKGIMMGPKNYLARGYESMPISITVEGANILTRNLIIFGQGAIRCHPYLRQEMQALSLPLEREKEALQIFDRNFTQHIGYALANFVRLFFHSFTGGFFCSAAKINVHKNLTRSVVRLSIALAFISDVTLLLMGGKLKRKERLSARLGDVLSYLYMASASIKYYSDFGDKKEDQAYLKWVLQKLLYQAQNSFYQFFENFKNPILSCILCFLVFPYGRPFTKPKDSEDHCLVKAMMTPSNFRERLTSYYYHGTLENSEVCRLEQSFLDYFPAEAPLHKIESAVKQGSIPKHLDLSQKIEKAVFLGILNRTEASMIEKFEISRRKVIQVDEFTLEQLLGNN